MYLQPGQNFGPNISWRKCFSANCRMMFFLLVQLRLCKFNFASVASPSQRDGIDRAGSEDSSLSENWE